MNPLFSTKRKTIIIIGRHKLTEVQQKLLEKVFGNFEITEQINQIDVNNQEQINKLNSVDAIVIQALPLNLIAELLKKVNKPIFMFEIQAITVAPQEEAEKIAKQHNADIINIDPRTGNARISKTTGLLKIKAIKLETETVATV